MCAFFVLLAALSKREGKPIKNKKKEDMNMPKIEMHAPFTTFSGTVGQLVYRKVRGRTIVAMKPDPDRPLSEKETAHRQVFTQAATWAKAAMQDEELRPFSQIRLLFYTSSLLAGHFLFCR